MFAHVSQLTMLPLDVRPFLQDAYLTELTHIGFRSERSCVVYELLTICFNETVVGIKPNWAGSG